MTADVPSTVIPNCITSYCCGGLLVFDTSSSSSLKKVYLLLLRFRLLRKAKLFSPTSTSVNEKLALKSHILRHFLRF
ncbi:hypothetical protein Ancab_023821 [Ancistrocladus abbreviatus]